MTLLFLLRSSSMLGLISTITAVYMVFAAIANHVVEMAIKSIEAAITPKNAVFSFFTLFGFNVVWSSMIISSSFRYTG